jgi:hypothetical protein
MRTYALALLCASLVSGSTISAAKVSFHGISVGQSVSTLPFKCADEFSCAGTVGGDYVRVSVTGSLVEMFDVIYEGKTLTVPEQSITSPPITLAQALKLHSLQAGASLPKLGFAKDNKRAIYGVADAENGIVYTTTLSSTQMGASQVNEVIYLSSTAPVLKESKHALLKGNDAASLLAEARTAPSYTSAATISKPDVSTTPSDANLVATTKKEAVQILSDQIDVVDGKGKMTLALIEKVSIWYTVDKDHPQAVEAQEQLRKFYSEYQVEWRRVMDIARVNENLFLNHDEAFMLSDYLDRNTEIERKMRSLVAMGFSL